MSFSNLQNVGAELKNFYCGSGRLVAAGAGDNTEVVGATIDRMAANGRGFDSGKLVINGSATLTEAKVLKIGTKYAESDDGSSWDTAVVIEAATTVATGGSGGSSETFQRNFDVNLRTKKRYIRFNITPDLDATATDIAQWAASFVAGGADRDPVSNKAGSVA